MFRDPLYPPASSSSPPPPLHLPAFTPGVQRSATSSSHPRHILSPSLCFAPTNWYSHLERNSCQATINFTGGILAAVQPPRVSNDRREKEKRGDLDEERERYIDGSPNREYSRIYSVFSLKPSPLGTLYVTYDRRQL